MTEKRKKKKGSILSGVGPYYIIIGSIIVLLTIILLLFENIGSRDDGAEQQISERYIEQPQKPAAPAAPETQPVRPEQPSVPPSRPDPEPAVQKPADAGSLVFVIDDVGNNLQQLEYFLKIPFPVTFAIMPDRKFSEESAERILKAGHEYIIHQPMEAVHGQDPGASAIYTGMSREQIFEVLEHNFNQLPGAYGMNNHMGSKATSDSEVMDAVMEYLAVKGKAFIDSFTISTSVAEEAALRHNVRYLRRNSMFLDNEKDHESIQAAINQGVKKARTAGHAVMIGHIMTGELADTMMELYPNFIEDGFSLKEISEIFVEMSRPGDIEVE